MTAPEQKLWQKLRGLRVVGSHFRRQAPMGPFFADFVCHELRRIVEIDGATHTATNELLADKERSNYFQSHGYRVLRFWNNQVMSETDAVVEVIHKTMATIADTPPPLTPPHALRAEEGNALPSPGERWEESGANTRRDCRVRRQ